LNLEFLPQLYIESIVRGKSFVNTIQGGESNQFNKFIEELIRQEDDINDLFIRHNETIQASANRINENITEWIKQDRVLSQLHEELLPLGDKNAISNEIRRQENNIVESTKSAGLSIDELNTYNKLTKENETLQLEIGSINNDESELIKLSGYISTQLEYVWNSNTSFASSSINVNRLWDEFKTEIISSLKTQITAYEEKFRELSDVLHKRKEDIEISMNSNEAKLAPLLAKNKIQEDIRSIEKEISAEKAKITIIEDKIAEITAVKNRRDAIDFIGPYKDMCDSYNKLREQINKIIATKWNESETHLRLTSKAVFNASTFIEAIKSVINVKSYLENQFPDSGFHNSEYVYNEDNHLTNINKMLNKLIADNNRFSSFKAGGNTESTLRALYKDCFYIDYDITKSGDSLKNMSEGKKGIVILQLYLSLSKADCPILIDQPEDNLDNRTVFKELMNNYIKRCKQRRQIIMVSHNANLVVNTDAENIIVANQSGQDDKENRDYKFEYVNGALENTFAHDETIKGILYQQGIREHVCEILEGGVDAFERRELKYSIKKLIV
jgi:hypothetical protein